MRFESKAVNMKFLKAYRFYVNLFLSYEFIKYTEIQKFSKNNFIPRPFPRTIKKVLSLNL